MHEEHCEREERLRVHHGQSKPEYVLMLQSQVEIQEREIQLLSYEKIKRDLEKNMLRRISEQQM